MRYLLIRYPGFLFSVLFIGTMLLIGHVVAPLIVHHYGLAGTIVAISAMLAIAWLMDRRH